MKVPVPQWIESPQHLAVSIESVSYGVARNHVVSALEHYTVLSYWYAVAKDEVRRAKRGSEEYKEAKRNEDILEGFVKSAQELIQVIKHLNNKEQNA